MAWTILISLIVQSDMVSIPVRFSRDLRFEPWSGEWVSHWNFSFLQCMRDWKYCLKIYQIFALLFYQCHFSHRLLLCKLFSCHSNMQLIEKQLRNVNIVIIILSSKLTFEVFTSMKIKIVVWRDEKPCSLAIHLDRTIILPKMEAESFLLNVGTYLSNYTSLQPWILESYDL
jgi:hypothetical protein